MAAERRTFIIECDLPDINDEAWLSLDSYLYEIAALVGPKLAELVPTSPMTIVYGKGRKREGVWVNDQGEVGKFA